MDALQFMLESFLENCLFFQSSNCLKWSTGFILIFWGNHQFVVVAGLFHCWNTWLYCSRSAAEERLWNGVWLVSAHANFLMGHFDMTSSIASTVILCCTFTFYSQIPVDNAIMFMWLIVLQNVCGNKIEWFNVYQMSRDVPWPFV